MAEGNAPIGSDKLSAVTCPKCGAPFPQDAFMLSRITCVHCGGRFQREQLAPPRPVVTARQRWGGKSRERYSLTYRYVIDGRQHSRTQEVSESKYHYAQDGKTITLTYLPVWPALAHTGDTDFSRQRTEILISVCLIIEATLGYVHYRHPPRARGAAI